MKKKILSSFYKSEADIDTIVGIGNTVRTLTGTWIMFILIN